MVSSDGHQMSLAGERGFHVPCPKGEGLGWGPHVLMFSLLGVGKELVFESIVANIN